jgi:hypothetical protein
MKESPHKSVYAVFVDDNCQFIHESRRCLELGATQEEQE